MGWADDLGAAITGHSAFVVVAVLLLTLGVGVGASQVERSTSLEVFQPESTEAETLDYIERHYRSDNNRSVAQVLVRDENVLDRETYLAVIEYELALRANGTVNETLVENGSMVAVPNLVATAAIRQERANELRDRRTELNRTAGLLRRALGHLREDRNASIRAAFVRVNRSSSVALTEDDYRTFRRAARSLRAADNRSEARAAYRLGTRGVLSEEYRALRASAAELRDGVSPTLAAQRSQLESMNESEVETVTERVLSEDRPGSDRALRLMPSDYEPGTADANATVLLVTHRAERSTSPADAPAQVIDAQHAMTTIGEAQAAGAEYVVFGEGIVAAEIDTSMQDSLQLVTPLAFLFVLVVLVVAYRDLLDVVLGLLGVGLVLVWTFGFLGWAGIAFKQVFIIVPALLVGLSIDFGIHVVMRYREERGADSGQRRAMRHALGGLGAALVMVSATTSLGFLSNVTSPAPPIREVGIVSAVGIVATLVVFGALLPALKVELEGALERRGVTRMRPAFGTGGGALSRLLSVGRLLGTRFPYAVLVLALVVSAAGAYGTANVDSSFATEDFLADEPPAWLDDLPEPLAPADYSAKSTMAVLDERYVRQDRSAQLLVEGDVTRPTALDRVHAGQRAAANASVTAAGPGGEEAIRSPLTVMRDVAARNETFNESFRAADTDGDGVPDRNLTGVYDTLYAVAPDRADDVVERSPDGSYRTLRLVVLVEGDAAGDDVIDQMAAVETAISGGGLTATATGQVIMDRLTQDSLMRSVISSLAVTLVAVLLLLVVIYRVIEGSAALGVVTLLPVLFVVTWVGGTMSLLDVPVNIATALIASLTIGLGVDHSLHLSERYAHELREGRSPGTALQRTVTGTGGALFGSAATTVGGFGMLLGALLPPVRQLGLISAISIGYSFLAAILVLPGLLVLWTRYAAPPDLRPGGDGPGGDPNGRPESAAPAAGPAERDERAGPPVDASTGDEPAPRRTFSQAHVCPGQRVEATVELDRLRGRAVLEERPGGAGISNVSVRPQSAVASRVTAGETLYVAVRPGDTGPVVLSYEATVPESASEGAAVTFAGSLHVPGGEVPVAGDDAATVVDDLFEGVLLDGAVTDADLRLAAEQFAAGEFSERQLTHLYSAWLTTDDASPDTLAGDEP